ncbi:MAG TPA: AAA family ATPase, partial [Pirellulales bacterium]|nr:AAA family ATPase [Pirellulales bacterium]
MKIHGLEVDGFGAWNGLTMSGFTDGLTVVYGPNEAGKTTLMQFVRAMLYGFSDDRRARYLPPVGGGRGGGRLHISNGRGRVVVGRHDDPRHAIDGLVRIVDARDGEQNAPSLESLLSGIDEPIFRNVFAIGMREIQELGSLSDTAAADMLYKLATGLDRVSLVEVLRELDASRNRLLAADGKPSQITQLRGDRGRLSDEAARLAQQSREYARLTQDRQRIDEALASLELEQRQCQERLDWLEKAAAGREPWQRRGEIAAELKALGDVRALRAGAIEEFEALEARYQLWKRRHSSVNRRRKLLRRDARKLRIRDWIVRHGSRIEALCEQRGWLKSLAVQTAQLEKEIEQSTLQLSDMHRELGLPQPVEGKPSFDAVAVERLK